MFMARLFLSLSFLVQLAALPAGAQPADAAHTRASLKADASSLLPGSTVSVGVLLRMDRGWHTYWVNAGEAGLPTEIAWTLPDGFSTGAIQWPLPNKYIEAGDVLTYGYEDETMLLVPLTVPQSARPGERVTLKAEVSWLECEKTCVPGREVIALTLPVGDGQRDPATASLFDRYRTHIPARLTDVRDISVSSRESAGAVVLTLTPGSGVTLSQESVDFYPMSGEPLTVGRSVVSADGRTITRPVASAQPPGGPRRLRALSCTGVREAH
ncbi:MAG: thiol:disulfide interchange protein, partial [Bacteroidetes bacterium]|nr:thiol:disulfide interchange protein [Bacteroidota bacterium]